MNRRLFSVIGGALLLAVCTPRDDSTARAAAADTVTVEDVQGGATISGKVKFTGAAPRNPAIDMSEEAACKAK